MKKIARVLSILLGIGVLTAIAGFIAIKKMFPPEKVKELIVREVSGKLKREVHLGEIQIGIFSGISIKDFSLSESPTFKKGTFVHSDQFVLKFQLLPLLQKKIIIDEIVLQAPQVYIVQNADGKTYNFSDLIAASQAKVKQAAQEEQKPTAQSVALVVSKATLSKGKVEYIDKTPRQMNVVLNPLHLTIVSAALDKPLLIDLAVTIESSIQRKKVKGDLQARALLDIQNQKVQLDSLQWKMDGAILDLKGTVSNFAKPEVDLSASLHDVKIQELSQWVSLPKNLRISGSPKAGIDLKGQMDHFNLSAALDLSKTDLSFSDFFQKDDKTDFSISVNGKIKKQKDVTLDSLKIKIASLEAELKGEIQNAVSSNPTLKMELNTKPVQLKEISKLSKLADPYQPSGLFSLQGKAYGIFPLLKAEGSVILDKIGATYKKMSLEAMAGKVNFTDHSVAIPQFSGKIAAGDPASSDFQVRASLENFQRPDISLEADFAKLNLGMFSGDSKKENGKKEDQQAVSESQTGPPYRGPEIKVKGKVKLGKLLLKGFEANEVHLDWKLTGVTPNLNKISGMAEIKTADGKLNLKNVSFLKHLRTVFEMANKFTNSSLGDPGALVFQNISGTYLFQDGVAKTDNFHIQSAQADIQQKGTIRLSDLDKNLLISLKLPKGSIGGTVGQFSTDEEGRPTFAFKITGTEKTQKVTMDTSLAQKRATEELKKKGTEILQNEGKNFLEGLLKR